MKKLFLPLLAVGLLAGCVDAGHLFTAGTNLYKAGTVSDSDLKEMSKKLRAQQDAQANVAPANSSYTKRLNKLMENLSSVNGTPINYKVYMTPEVNANATQDGSVRVYSGLMDKMNDDELRFVIGHEIGHVAEGHSLNKMRMAYATAAARAGAGAISPTAATISDSQLGSLGEEFMNAQYSQAQESNADAYAMNFLKKNNYNTAAAGSALRKLANEGGGSGGLAAAFFSTHPDSMKRAEKMDQMARGEIPASSTSAGE